MFVHRSYERTKENLIEDEGDGDTTSYWSARNNSQRLRKVTKKLKNQRSDRILRRVQDIWGDSNVQVL